MKVISLVSLFEGNLSVTSVKWCEGGREGGREVRVVSDGHGHIPNVPHPPRAKDEGGGFAQLLLSVVRSSPCRT